MKRILLVGGSVGVVLAITIAGTALAAESMSGSMHADTMKPSAAMMMHPPAPMVLSIDTNGMGRIRGVVTSVGTSSIMIAAWGGVWTITTNGATSVLPGGSSVSDIHVGDFIGVMGMVSEDGPMVAATLIRDWSSKGPMTHTGAMTSDHMTGSDSMPHNGAMMNDHVTATSSMTH